MLDMDQVRTLFSLFSDLTGDSAARWEGFCRAAAAYLEGRLRPGTDLADNMAALCIAAAGVAYSDYLAVQTAGGQSDELRVGEISLKGWAKTGGGDPGEIRRHFLDRCAHLLEPECPALFATGGKS